jgi:hypothetical protein
LCTHAIYKGTGGDAGTERGEVLGGDFSRGSKQRRGCRDGGRELRHLHLCKRNRTTKVLEQSSRTLALIECHALALVAGGRARVRTRLGAEDEVHGASLDGGDLRRMPQRRVARGEEEVEEGKRRDGACAPLQRVQNHALHAPDGRQVDHEVLGPLQHQSTIRHENAADFSL